MKFTTPAYFDDNKNFYKRNYVKATEIITPKVYLEVDEQLGGQDLDIASDIINTHLNIANNFSQVIISSIDGIVPGPRPPYDKVNNITGLSQFFVKQNNLTNIDANDFERRILLPLGKSLRDFDTSAEFKNYLVTELLPSIKLNKSVTGTGAGFESFDGAELDDGTYYDTGEVKSFDEHSYLIRNLSWIYFLNVSGATYDGSTIIADAIMDTIWKGSEFSLDVAMKCLTEYIYRNYSANPGWSSFNFLPLYYRPNLDLEDTTYTSGLQQLEKLKTLVGIIYSNDFHDRGDTLVKQAFESFLQNRLPLDQIEIQGPFYKFLKAISYAFCDYNNYFELLEFINDAKRCPDRFLPYIADLVGWRLIGSEPQRWRYQILNCVSIYKAGGTKLALQRVVDSTFSPDIFNASATIQELWESYIPHLVYYSLATESPFFADASSWTLADAEDLSVTYVTSSIDEAVKCAVDKILLDTAEQFKFKFYVQGDLVPVTDPKCKFKYRGRDYSVPPFEEYLYWVNQPISKQIVNFIIDKLIVCFLVPESFAFEVRDYLLANTTLQSENDIALGYTWLTFTSGASYPPNWDTVILDISNKKPEYLSLWNGKSSHFKLFFDANSFRFIRDSILFNSIEGIKLLNEIIDEFSPAHAIKQVYFRLYSEDIETYAQTELDYLLFDKLDSNSLNESDTVGFANYELSGHDLQFYKRGQTTGYNLVDRTSTDSLVDSLMQVSAIAAPRKSFRRRNYRNILPREGLYSRTGHNMPTTFTMEVFERSLSSTGFLSLGLIPSSQTYVQVNDTELDMALISGAIFQTPTTTLFKSWRSIPDIYDICEGLNSSSIYSGLIVSATFPCRGLRALNLEAISGDYTVDRGQLNYAMKLMHYIGDRKTYVLASALVESNSAYTFNKPAYLDIVQSLANEISNSSGFPNSFEDYENFEFGRDLHRLHRDYCNYFNRHSTIRKDLNVNGPNIFAHSLGSILRNSDFELFGSAVTARPDIITRNTSATYRFVAGEDFFPENENPASGAFIVSAPSSFPYSEYSYEIANSAILEGIDLIHTYGGNDNYFEIYRLSAADPDYETTWRVFQLNYPYFTPDNTIIKIKNGFNFTLPRLRMDLKTYSHDSEKGHPLQTNFLVPEHKFKLTIKALATNDTFTEFDRISLGVFIHTAYEKDGTWVYTPQKKWKFVPSEDLTASKIKDEFAIRLNLSSYEIPAITRFCGGTRSVTELRSIYDIATSSFNTYEIELNTKNQPIAVPEFYYKTYQQVHRQNQNYFIELFAYDHPTDFMLIDNINLVDMTLNKWSKPLVSAVNSYYPLNSPSGNPIGDFYLKQHRVDLDKEKLYDVLRFFRDMAGTTAVPGLATRAGDILAGKFEAQGGSRLNYRINSDWPANTTVDFGLSLINTLYLEN